MPKYGDKLKQVAQALNDMIGKLTKLVDNEQKIVYTKITKKVCFFYRRKNE